LKPNSHFVILPPVYQNNNIQLLRMFTRMQCLTLMASQPSLSWVRYAETNPLCSQRVRIFGAGGCHLIIGREDLIVKTELIQPVEDLRPQKATRLGRLAREIKCEIKSYLNLKSHLIGIEKQKIPMTESIRLFFFVTDYFKNVARQLIGSI
jgi:hypothetical protein